MKWLIAMVVFSCCAASALSRIGRIRVHRQRGGPMMKKRIFGSLGVALSSLGWAAAVAMLMGLVRRGPVWDWVLLCFAAFTSGFMAWTLVRADTIDKIGGDVQERQKAALVELNRARAEAEARRLKK